MEYVVLFYNGLKVIPFVENNFCNLMVITFNQQGPQGSILVPLF